MSDILSIAASALRANQFALSIIGQNIASASDPDYSRQEVVFSSINGQGSNQSSAGQGVVAQGARRFYDQAIVDRLRQANSQLQSANITTQYASQLSHLVSDSNTSLTTQLQDFFNAFQNAANDPSSISSRNQIISASNDLKNRFSSIHQSVIDQFDSVNQQVSDNIVQANQLISQLASINSKLQSQNNTNTFSQPNSLLDNRDKLLLQLSNLLDIKTTEKTNGSVDVFLKTGENLISGSTASALGTKANDTLSQQPDITLSQDGQSTVITNHVNGGALGGLTQYRDGTLKTFDTGFKTLAADFVSDINKQHANGLTLNNAIGGDLFSTDSISGADLFTVAISNPNDIALASPILVSASSTNTGTAEVNQVSILSTDTNYFNKTNKALNPPVIVRFDTATSYSILNKTIPNKNVGNAIGNNTAPTGNKIDPIGNNTAPAGNNTGNNVVILSGQTFLPGQTNELFADSATANDGKLYTGYQVSLNGIPQAGDSFTVDYNTGGFLDNTNAVALSDLKDAIQSAYTDSMNSVNTSANTASTDQSTFNTLFQQAKTDKQSLSGVNLDEEGVRLTQYQQAFNAATQMLSIYKDLFDNLLQIL